MTFVLSQRNSWKFVPSVPDEDTPRDRFKKIEMKRRLEELIFKAKHGDREAASEGYALCVKLEKSIVAMRRWALVRRLVRIVRPSLLCWMELVAMRQEERRILWAKRGVIQDHPFQNEAE